MFSLVLPLYDAFHLSRAAHAQIPAGPAVFTEVGPNATSEDVLTQLVYNPVHDTNSIPPPAFPS